MKILLLNVVVKVRSAILKEILRFIGGYLKVLYNIFQILLVLSNFNNRQVIFILTLNLMKLS
jgi:hypothetical protein